MLAIFISTSPSQRSQYRSMSEPSETSPAPPHPGCSSPSLIAEVRGHLTPGSLKIGLQVNSSGVPCATRRPPSRPLHHLAVQTPHTGWAKETGNPCASAALKNLSPQLGQAGLVPTTHRPGRSLRSTGCPAINLHPTSKLSRLPASPKGAGHCFTCNTYRRTNPHRKTASQGKPSLPSVS